MHMRYKQVRKNARQHRGIALIVYSINNRNLLRLLAFMLRDHPLLPLYYSCRSYYTRRPSTYAMSSNNSVPNSACFVHSSSYNISKSPTQPEISIELLWSQNLIIHLMSLVPMSTRLFDTINRFCANNSISVRGSEADKCATMLL